jgi:hypothetical protein
MSEYPQKDKAKNIDTIPELFDLYRIILLYPYSPLPQMTVQSIFSTQQSIPI